MWGIFEDGFDDDVEDEVENLQNFDICGMPDPRAIEEGLWSLYDEGMINDEELLQRLYNEGLIDKDFLKNEVAREQRWNELVFGNGEGEELLSGHGEEDLQHTDGELSFGSSSAEEAEREQEEAQKEAREREEKMEELQKEYADAQHDLEKASKELEDLISDQEKGWIGLEPAIGWREARIKDAQQRMSEIEREMARL